MTTTEDRLRDAFATIDRQVTPPPLLEADVAPRRPPVRWLAAAAAVLALVAGATFVTTRDGERDAVIAEDPDEVTFDDVAGRLCRRLFDGRMGAYPRFATAEAYRIVAESRLALLASMQPDVDSMPEAPGSSDLRERVAELLAGATERAELVISAATNGVVDSAAVQFDRLERYIDTTIDLLAGEGVEPCQRS